MARSTRLSANIAVGTGKQNDALLPPTLTFRPRPSRIVFVSAKYRRYDLDNRTPVFEREADVQFDGAFHANTPGESEYHNRKSNQVDFDVSFMPIPFTALRVGYGYNQTDRTHRVWEVTKDNVFRASMDTTGN